MIGEGIVAVLGYALTFLFVIGGLGLLFDGFTKPPRYGRVGDHIAGVAWLLLAFAVAIVTNAITGV